MTEIKTKGIESIREKYLKRFSLPSVKGASLQQGSKLFFCVIEDFKRGELSSDELSTFGFEIFHGIAKHYPKSDLFQASLSASELIFSIRSKAVYNNILTHLKAIDDFYNKSIKK